MQFGKKYRALGTYELQEDAARAVDKVARILGRSYLNFPISDGLEINGPRSEGADEAVTAAVEAARTFMAANGKVSQTSTYTGVSKDKTSNTTKGGDSTDLLGNLLDAELYRVRGESQLSCSEAFERERRSRMKRRLGCYGVSPGGLRFVYVQPQHTGTGTVCPTIEYTPFAGPQSKNLENGGLAWKSCRHHHPPEAWGEDADVAFVFSNNPYRRVLTSAVYQEVIPAAATTSPSQQNIQDFRAWVKRNRDGPHRALYSMSEQIANANVRTTFVGRVSSLTDDLNGVMRLIGLDVDKKKNYNHCISSCDHVQPEDRVGTIGPQREERVKGYGTFCYGCSGNSLGNCQQFPTPVFQCHAGKWKRTFLRFPTPVFVQPRVQRAAAKGFWLLENKMHATRSEI